MVHTALAWTPYFNVGENSLAVKGVVIAIPHVRGGSEKGQTWYKAGYKTTKPNTWKDFNSCAEYLITRGYTSAGKLAGTGYQRRWNSYKQGYNGTSGFICCSNM
jgi:prolyl oligopeptidase